MRQGLGGQPHISEAPQLSQADGASSSTRQDSNGRSVALYPDELGWLREALALNAEEPDDDEDDDLEPLL
jgi:hypothetical protein